ncbi:MAG: 50S ribosomal protein L4 [Phycisphaerae bacterium]|nr:50S ribosomal protein L4 [Phycisphaerae bacterium]
MIEIPVLDTKGERIGSEMLDPAAFGSRVRHDLLKQAVVAYRASRRQGTAVTKSRGMVHGASRKLYRQKGTGRSRAGNLRTPLRVGGGRTFAKVTRDFSKKLPRKMRRLARNSAILARALSGTAFIVEGLRFDVPKTSRMFGILKATGTDRGALLAVASESPILLKSVRNIPNVEMKLVADVNAYDVLRRRNLVFTPEAFKALTVNPESPGRSTEA